jgi:hypothetical protein
MNDLPANDVTLRSDAKHSRFKAACLEALRHAVPDGCDNAQMHRNVIRLYAAGWGDCMAMLHKRGTVSESEWEEVKRELNVIQEPNWWPKRDGGDGWSWWV